MKRALVIDGNNYYNVAYYASKSEGFGEYLAITFFRMLSAAYKVFEREYEFLFVAWDSKENNRKKEFPYYKANRKEKPDNFYDMMPYIQGTLEARKVQQYEVKGFEGDDIIAKVVSMCEEKGYSVTVASGDHDMYQLLSDNVIVYDPVKKTIVTADDFRRKHELEPEQWKFVKALMGDTSDHVPGVKGVGEKGAHRCIKEYGSLDGLFASDMKALRKGIVTKLTAKDEEYDAKKSAYEALELVSFRDVDLEYPENAGIHPIKVNPSIFVGVDGE